MAVGAKNGGDYLVFVDNLKSSLTFFKDDDGVLTPFLTPAMQCLRHKAYNSPLIIG